MFAEIITIGDEILIGQIVDSNSAFLAKELNRIGISVYQVTSVQDDIRHIKKALSEAEANADIIIMTGGLGPTKDDITKNTLASYFDDVLVQNDLVLKNIEDLWRKYVKQDLAQVNIDQALVPSRAKVLMNHHGSAPGMWLEKENKDGRSIQKNNNRMWRRPLTAWLSGHSKTSRQGNEISDPWI